MWGSKGFNMAYKVTLCTYEDFLEYNNSLKSKNLPEVSICHYTKFEWVHSLDGVSDKMENLEHLIIVTPIGEKANCDNFSLIYDDIDYYNFKTKLNIIQPLIPVLAEYLKKPRFYITNPEELLNWDFSIEYAIAYPREVKKYLNGIAANFLLLGVEDIAIGPLRLSYINSKWSLSSFNNKFSNTCYIPSFVNVVGTGNRIIELGTNYEYNLKRVICYARDIEIGDAAFEYCSSLESFLCRDGISKAGKFAFDNCSNLKEIKFNKNFTRVQVGTFNRCESLTSVKLPKHVVSIDTDSFCYCRNLSEVNFEELNELKCIHEWAFSGCSLKVLNFSDNASLYRIRDSAFRLNSKLTDVSLPSSLEEIGEAAFMDCNNLHTFDLSRTNVKVLKPYMLDGSPVQEFIFPRRCSINNGKFAIPKGFGSSGYRSILRLHCLPCQVIFNGKTYNLKDNKELQDWLTYLNFCEIGKIIVN